MKFPVTATREEIIRAKRQRISERRKEFYNQWLTKVAPRYLDRPLPDIHTKPLPSNTPQIGPAETEGECRT